MQRFDMTFTHINDMAADHLAICSAKYNREASFLTQWSIALRTQSCGVLSGNRACSTSEDTT